MEGELGALAVNWADVHGGREDLLPLFDAEHTLPIIPVADLGDLDIGATSSPQSREFHWNNNNDVAVDRDTNPPGSTRTQHASTGMKRLLENPDDGQPGTKYLRALLCKTSTACDRGHSSNASLFCPSNIQGRDMQRRSSPAVLLPPVSDVSGNQLCDNNADREMLTRFPSSNSSQMDRPSRGESIPAATESFPPHAEQDPGQSQNFLDWATMQKLLKSADSLLETAIPPSKTDQRDESSDHNLNESGEKQATLSTCSESGTTMQPTQLQKCTLCGLCFRHDDALLAHLRLTHSDANSFECPHCAAKLDDLQLLGDHMKVHLLISNISATVASPGEDTDSTECDTCHALFSSSDELRDHVTRLHHDDDSELADLPELDPRPNPLQTKPKPDPRAHLDVQVPSSEAEDNIFDISTTLDFNQHSSQRSPQISAGDSDVPQTCLNGLHEGESFAVLETEHRHSDDVFGTTNVYISEQVLLPQNCRTSHFLVDTNDSLRKTEKGKQATQNGVHAERTNPACNSTRLPTQADSIHCESFQLQQHSEAVFSESSSIDSTQTSEPNQRDTPNGNVSPSRERLVPTAQTPPATSSECSWVQLTQHDHAIPPHIPNYTTYKCPTCNLAFSCDNILQKHYRNHVKKRKKRKKSIKRKTKTSNGANKTDKKTDTRDITNSGNKVAQNFDGETREVKESPQVVNNSIWSKHVELFNEYL